MVAVMLVLFVTLVQLTSMKINLEHPVLEWLGSISMGIYLIHGFVLGILRSSVIYIEENWIYALLSVVITVMIASLKSINFQKKERYGKEV